MPTADRRPSVEEARSRLEDNPVVTVYDFVALTQQGELAVRRSIADGTIPTIKLGRRIRIPSSYVRDLLGLEAGRGVV